MEPIAPPPGLTVRAMSREEVERLAVPWAAAEGWNPGLNDGPVFHAADPQGFFLAEKDGQALGCISAVNYGRAYCFLGFFLVVPGTRGQGVGYALSQAALAHAGKRVMGLDGVVAQQDNYRASGFEYAFTSVRYARPGGGEAEPPESGRLKELASLPWERVLAYDQAHFPAPRPEFLRGWLAMPAVTALGLVHGGELKGYGVLRPCQEGHKIGPLFADGPEQARALYLALAGRAAGGPVYLDAPQNNPHAVALARGLGMEPVFETARMYKNGRPAWPAEEIFGITSFELG
ncbi:MAG: GNAT family N-acetyltransferase [Desulfarculaceae bacterium]|nr:GNAT family N-acetyltransferase [Desulfarculaceae bacterium]MCF8072083.1 GNAT family N-acetyltransferase [Desulfarculaceae bacterium]MCF8101600.1 GNAT family N-acetyltransferase [Desulfarculaceae bacterium]MCF8115150.1 GNAT family N-acetyltransferase [Desulfarculaceae bacterium]